MSAAERELWDQDDSYDELLTDNHLYGGSRLGGYASFLNSDPRDPVRPDTLLLQLSLSYGELLIHIFVPLEDLKIGRFDRAWGRTDAD